MGEIAEALRKANQAVDANDPSNEAPGLRHNEETSGEITAALSRAQADEAGTLPPDTGDDRKAAPATPQAPPETTPVIPANLGEVIFHVERHRHLGLRLRTEMDRTGGRTLAVVSAVRNEGKSIVSCNIAAAIASLSSERSVALVDLDLRNPSIAAMLQISVPVGIEQVLLGRAKLEDTCISLREPEIDVYPCAQPHRAAHELLVLPAFERFIRDLESRYAAVIIDTPPALLVPDSTIIMRSASYCVAVARAGKTRVHRFSEMIERLPQDKLLGKVINNVPLPSHAKGDEYYYYYANEDEL
ncbi:MAG: CpsD/CapB family tyrosine-protein kinase [Myxococcota bacterium]|nr:CpsD/CapB family tyrosine-protein kinase [Myxococcota bacterium]